jgi:hypothetical protein
MSDSESYSAPKGALGVGQARHPAVEAVEHHGDEDRHRRPLEIALHRLDDGIEAGEQRRRGEQVGQDVNAAPRRSGLNKGLRGLSSVMVKAIG